MNRHPPQFLGLLAAMAAGPWLVSCSKEDPAFTSAVTAPNASSSALEVDPKAQDSLRSRNPLDPADSSPVSKPIQRSKSFDLRDPSPVTGEFLLHGSLSTHSVVIEARHHEETLQFKQPMLPVVTDSFRQGRADERVSETFSQPASGVLDLLVVIDNSKSMAEEQKNLSTKLLPLLEAVSEADWRLAITTTDPAEGCLRALMAKGQEGIIDTFERGINAGIGGTGNEQGFRQAASALNCASAPWVRPSSSLAVLFVSDEDNCSAGGADCEGEPWAKEDYLLSFIEGPLARKIGSEARIYGLFGHPNDRSCKTAYNTATQYASIVAKTSGTWGSICAADYSATLSRISTDMATLLKDQFALRSAPVAGSTSIKIIGTNGSATPWPHFTVSGSVVSFSTPPPAGATVEVSYLTPGEPQVLRFELSQAPHPYTVMVSIDGSESAPSAYAVQGQSLVFVSPPPASSNVVIAYQAYKQQQNTFDIGRGVVPGSLAVTTRTHFGTEVLAPFSYDPSSGNLVFVDAPPPGSTLLVRFKRDSGLRTDYPIPVAASHLTSLEARFEDGTPVSAELIPPGKGQDSRPGLLRLLEPSALRAGMKVIMVVERETELSQTFALPSLPQPGTLDIETSDPSCSLGQGIVLEGATLKVMCTPERDLAIGYRYQGPSQSKRRFALGDLATDKGPVQWAVTLDSGAPLPQDAFHIHAGVLTLSDTVALEDVTSVKVTVWSLAD